MTRSDHGAAPDPMEHRITVPRTARYYTLGGESGAREVWVVLHGFGQLAGRFINWFSPVATADRLIVAPEGLSRYYTDHASRKVGATWMTSEDRLTEIADYVRYLDLVLRDVFASRGVLPDARVEVHGFSQGASTASRWVAFGEVQPARLVLWAGGMPPDLDLVANQQRFARAGVTIVIGDRDEFISEDAVAEQASRLSTAAVPCDLRRFRGGHVIPWLVLEELAGMRGRN